MSLPQINVSDYSEGFLKISTNNFTEVNLQSYINRFLEIFLKHLIGDPAYVKLVNLSPNTQKWDDLLSGVVYERDGKQYENVGLKTVLISLIYSQYVNDDFQSSMVGKVKNNSENSVTLMSSAVATASLKRWNEAVRNVNCSIIPFLNNYTQLTSNITNVNNVGTTYTIFTDSTFYLDNEDNVTIGSEKYEVRNVVENVSFDITAELGTVFPSEFTYRPFELVDGNNYNYMTL